MNRAWDIFYAANDALPTAAVTIAVAVGVGFTLAAAGNSIQIVSTTGYIAGQNVFLVEGGKPTSYGTIMYVIDSTHFWYLPAQSALDGSGVIGTGYTTSCLIVSTGNQHLVLSIDLSDAPDGTYNYVVVGAANFSCESTSGRASAFMRSASPQGDAFSPNTVKGLASASYAYGSYTLGNEQLLEAYAYNHAHYVSLTAGSVYEFSLNIQCVAGSGLAWMRNGRILAFRVGSITKVDNSEDATGIIANATPNTNEVK